ncbi:MAG TPA: M23 family metallopeptidase [Candidatus Obscuribacterales bacterium]
MKWHGFACIALLAFGGSPNVQSGLPPAGTTVHQSGLPPAATKVPAEPKLTDAQTSAAIAELRGKHLLMPIQGVDPERLRGSFYEMRANQIHGAVDILAPRYTPILATEDGVIAKLWLSKAGGTTIYEFDPSGKYVYYYAHLSRYADGLKEKQHVKRGDVIGYVGTSGNAPPNTPHLHFSIAVLTIPGRWWTGTAIDPYEVFKGTAVSGKPMSPVPPQNTLESI